MRPNKKLDPMCIKGEIAMAVTNRGELIPCCRCDDPHTTNDPKFKKLLEASKISDYDSIDEILKTKEWKRFFKNLQNNKGPNACWYTCQANKPENHIQTLTSVDTEHFKPNSIERR